MKTAGSVCLIIVFLSNIFLSEAVCKGSAKYKLTFKPEWTIVTHPSGFPPNPHFSSVVGCSHNSSYVMWRPGMNATPGVQRVAETGSPSIINNEMDIQISLKRAFDKFQGNVISNLGTSVVYDIQVNTDYPLVSAISMIAPSPDWFVGVRDYSLCNDTTGKWIDKRVRNLPLYDAGTDSAKLFVHTNTPTNPHVAILLITNIPEGSNDTLNKFGTFTFEKTFDSSEGVSPTSSVATPADMPPSTMIEIPNPSTSKAKSTTMLANTEGTQKLIISNTTSNVMSPSIIASTTKSSSSKTTSSGESSVVHFGIFVFLKLMILNLFFANIL